MSKRKLMTNEMVARSKKKVLACSTPEHRLQSPSRDSDSVCDSDTGSPVPFLCTQDGAEGETDVVWNFYTPKAEKRSSSSHLKNTTPVSRKSKRIRSKLIEKPLPKKRTVRPSQKKTELFQDLIELNQNLHELISKKSSQPTETDKVQSCSEEDIFSDTSESSPKSCLKTNNLCLRKNVLSSKFKKPEPENGLDSDDSMNECLLKASQIVEDHINNSELFAPKRPHHEVPNNKTNSKVPVGNDSIDSFFGNIKLDSPFIYKAKNYGSQRCDNDSFDNLLGDLNDSALDRLSQVPIKDTKKVPSTKESGWVLQDLSFHGESPSSKSIFVRHSSMPESPSFKELNKPSSSGMALGRYQSMPFNKSNEKIIVPGDSPIRCTPDEIKKKHQQAREKLMAKRLLPFTASQQSSQIPMTQTQDYVDIKPKKSVFQPRIAGASVKSVEVSHTIPIKPVDMKTSRKQTVNDSSSLKSLIEKKRQEALMKLRRRQLK